MELHDRFNDWLAAGAEGEPPRDLAVHASGCDACLRSLAAIDSLQAIDIGAASLPPLGMVAPAARDSLSRTLRYAVGTVAVILLGGSVAIGASGLLRPAPLGSDQEARSPGEGVLAGVPSASATSQTPSPTPSASAKDSPAPSASATDEPPTAVLPTAAPQVLPHSTPGPQPLGTPRPTAAPTRTPTPTAAPTATPIVTPPPPTQSASPSIVVPTPTPTLEPTPTAAPTPTPQCSDGIDNDEDLLVDFPLDPGCTALDDDSEENFAP